jgi:hypothetical protein
MGEKITNAAAKVLTGPVTKSHERLSLAIRGELLRIDA